MSRGTVWSLVAVCTALSCTAPVYSPRVLPPSDLAGITTPPLKVHLNSGELLVLGNWRSADSLLIGPGTRYSKGRRAVETALFQVPLDSIALLETSVRDGQRGNPMFGMTTWTVLWSLTTLVCLADPKSCFGSCPTFYVDTPDGPVLAAEGFSSSILRVLEAEDTDALHVAAPARGEFRLLMRNEAWETHAVRDVRLLAVERPDGGRIMTDGHGRFFTVTGLRAAASCTAPDGPCIEAMRAPDGQERTSSADRENLAATETIELVFPGGSGAQGLVMSLRHSLLSTYLFYQTLGFLGTRAGETFANLERGGADDAREALGMQRFIGELAVDRWDGSEWIEVGKHDEAGPLAPQFVVIPMETPPADGEPVRIRLTAAKGAWRLDWVALADIGPASDPVTLVPNRVEHEGAADSTAFALISDPDRHLVTMPGDDYEFVFDLPPSTNGWDTFVSTTGYYYEWMRADWLDDEDLAMAAMIRHNPARALRVLAPGYGRAAPTLEARFWQSRFGRKP